jgi:hypothetical protein
MIKMKFKLIINENHGPQTKIIFSKVGLFAKKTAAYAVRTLRPKARAKTKSVSGSPQVEVQRSVLPCFTILRWSDLH